MRAHRCDKCGQFYQDTKYVASLHVYDVSRSGKLTRKKVDLCEGCQKELMKWFDGYCVVENNEKN